MTPSVARRALVPAVMLGLLLMAVPAGAHPFVEGGRAPVDSSATLDLAMAHGCDADAGGTELATTQVSVDVPEWMRVLEATASQGWRVELEGDGASPEVVSFTNPDSAQAAPRFELRVVLDGEVGQQRYFGVFQACEDASHRWVGTPDEPADEPAVVVELTEADPSAPPPETDVGADGEAGPRSGSAVADDAGDASDAATDDAGDAEADDADAAAGGTDGASAEDGAGDDGPGALALGWPVALVFGLVAGVGGFVFARNRASR